MRVQNARLVVWLDFISAMQLLPENLFIQARNCFRSDYKISNRAAGNCILENSDCRARARRRQMLLQGERERVFRRVQLFSAGVLSRPSRILPSSRLSTFPKANFMRRARCKSTYLSVCELEGGRANYPGSHVRRQINLSIALKLYLSCEKYDDARPIHGWLYLPPSGSNPFDEIDMCASALQRRGEGKTYSSVHYSNEGPF